MIDREYADLIKRLAVKRIDRDIQPLFLILDRMPPGEDKAAAMSHLHSMIGGLCAIRDLVALSERRAEKGSA